MPTPNRASGAGAEAIAIEQADALLFAMAGDAVAEDQDALEAFKRRFDGSEHASAINAIGVLTKADLLAADGRSGNPRCNGPRR